MTVAFSTASSLQAYRLRLTLVTAGFLLVVPISAQAVGFTVDSQLAWQDTGVNVVAGQQLIITATGTIFYGFVPPRAAGPDGDPDNFNPPSFAIGDLVNTANQVSLVGRIDGTLVPEGLPLFGNGFVGSSYSKVAPVSGRLFLAFNDSVYTDNSGSFDVTIVLEPEIVVPSLGPLAIALLGTLLGAAGFRRLRT